MTEKTLLTLEGAKSFILKDVQKQGFAVLTANRTYFTVGMGLKGKKDLIMPAVIREQAFRIIASLYYGDELEFVTEDKFLVKPVHVNTPSIGKEVMRCGIINVSEDEQQLYRNQLTSGYVEYKAFQGFTVIQPPDNDNRIYGEADCVMKIPADELLRQIVMELGNIEVRKADLATAFDAHAAKIIEKNKPIPRNRRKKNKSKMTRRR